MEAAIIATMIICATIAVVLIRCAQWYLNGHNKPRIDDKAIMSEIQVASVVSEVTGITVSAELAYKLPSGPTEPTVC